MEKKWYAVYTKPKWEKKVDSLLQKKEVDTWCPLQKVTRQWSDRKKVIEEPLFKSYVFVSIDQTERTKVLATDGILNFVYHVGKPAVIRNEEIELIKRYLADGEATITIEAMSSIAENTRIKVNHGIFMDTTGTVVKGGNKKVYVKLESLGQIMVVEFAVKHVSPIK